MPAGDLEMALRVAKTHRRKTVKVKNKDTGEVLYKSPEEFRENRDKYVELPHEYDRRTNGKPRRTPDPGNDYLPAPERLPRPKKRPKPKKLPKRVKIVPPPKVPEPPKPAPSDRPKALRWKR